MAQISVIGSSGKIDKKLYQTAYELGKIIASRGHILICGGRDGIMEAACKGAWEKGGITVGILPTINGEDANPYLTVKITTGMGYARNFINACSGDAVITVGGKEGTLSEIAMALVYGKPVICIKGTGEAADLLAGRRFGRKYVYAANNPEEAVKMAEDLLQDR